MQGSGFYNLPISYPVNLFKLPTTSSRPDLSFFCSEKPSVLDFYCFVTNDHKLVTEYKTHWLSSRFWRPRVWTQWVFHSGFMRLWSRWLLAGLLSGAQLMSPTGAMQLLAVGEGDSPLSCSYQPGAPWAVKGCPAFPAMCSSLIQGGQEGLSCSQPGSSFPSPIFDFWIVLKKELPG